MSYVAQFQNWLQKPVSARDLAFICLGLFFLDFVYSWLLALTLNHFGLIPNQPVEEYSTLVYIITFIFVAFWEELVFRIAPLTFAMRRWKLRKESLWVLVVSSIIFGVFHGGLLHLLSQGVVGLLYGMLFIKASQLGKRPVFAGTIVITMHLLFNLLIFAIMQIATI